MERFASVPVLGIGISVEELAPALPGSARFFELFVDAALPDLDAEVTGDPFAPPPTLDEYYAHRRAPVAAPPCLAHAGAIGPLSPMELDHLARTVAARGALWLSAEPVGYASGCAEDATPLPFTAAAVDEVVARAVALGERLAVPFVISSAPVPFAVGELHLADFLAAIAERTSCGVRLDLGHLVAYQVARGHAADHHLAALPLPRIVALHLQPGEIAHTRGVSHYRRGGDAIAPESLALLAALAGRCPELRAVSLRPPDAPAAIEAALGAVARALAGSGWDLL